MYQVESPANKALQGLNDASSTYGKMMKDIPANRDPGPTTGGAISAGMSGAAAGATALGTLGTAGTAAVAATSTTPAIAAVAPALLGMGPVGWVAGAAALGISAYLLS